MSTNHATWLSFELLMVFGPLEFPEGSTRAIVRIGEASLEADVRSISLPALKGDGSEWKLLTLAVRDGSHNERAVDTISIESAADGDAPPATLSVGDLPETVEACKSVLHEATCQIVLEFVSSAAVAHGIESDVAFSKTLFSLREMLRPGLPPVVIETERPQGAIVELFTSSDERHFYMQGWIRDSEAPISRLTAISPEGERVELLEGCFRYPRPDVGEAYDEPEHLRSYERHGFIAYLELERPSRLPTGWLVELENEARTAVQANVSPVIRDPIVARTAVLENLPFDALPDESLMSTKVFPVIDRIQQHARELVSVARIADFGPQPARPDVSLVIPLYGRIDFLEHQLAQFVHDPELKAAELIYVLDSPELDRQLRDHASHLFRLYQVPFRVLTMERPSGFAGATNAGASHARSRLLLLLNSDIFPSEPGWLGRMKDFHDSKERIGALGAKLLYEDDALQHAGMYFSYIDDTALAGAWANVHYFKGLNRDLPAANVPRRVPAVTGACLMIEKDLYQRMGGFTEVYVQGDYEDSELCLRLIEDGRENWYLPEVELYHLEGQSYASKLRGMTALYNRWLHTRRWGELIGTVMAEYDSMRPRESDEAPSPDGDRADRTPAGTPAEH